MLRDVGFCIDSNFPLEDHLDMKILYFILSLWILVVLPSYIQNSIPQARNQFDTYNKEDKPSRRQKDHRGSGRRYLRVNKS